MDLFRRMTGRKLKRKWRLATLSEQEAWLRDSLHHRPLEIRNSYDRNVARLGQKFQIGDSIAHTSLAHTLFVLNSGLINLINHALSGDSKKHNANRQSLLNLSEAAAVETLAALSQLSLRLNSHPQKQLKAIESSRKVEPKKEPRSKSTKSSSVPKKRSGSTPSLVRGAWVRPKASSVVSSASSKTSSSTSVAKHHRSKSESMLPKADSKKHLRSLSNPSDVPNKVRGQPEPVYEPVQQHHQRTFSDSYVPQRQPSMLIVPSDYFLSHATEPQSYTQQLPPPRPPKIPLHSRPNPSLRARPSSAGTFMTTSTKIGEIPEARTSRPAFMVEDQVRDPRLVQYLTDSVVADAIEPQKKKSRGRGLKFW